jgi:YHS domain-containing protein
MTYRYPRSRFRVTAILLTVALVVAVAASAADRSAVAPVNATNGIALKGYDPVAYFTVGQAMPGRDAYMFPWKGRVYRFASAENRNRFAAEPDKYVPRYGGYCAYAMAIDRIADIDPERWAIVDGKLYLNNNRFAHVLWSVNKDANIAAADGNWAAFPKAVEAR